MPIRLSLFILFFGGALTAQAITLVNDTPPETENASQVIEINLNADNDGWDDTDPDTNDIGSVDAVAAHHQDNERPVEATGTIESYAESAQMEHGQLPEELNHSLEMELPGKEVNFKLKVFQSTHHLVDGRARADIGKVLFKSRLMPSNEVKLSLTLKQKELDDIALTAYFDLANFTMELDGSNAVLNAEHKELMSILSAHLQHTFQSDYEGYAVPEHAFMLVQMLSYWSISPEGYVHEKRTVVSN